MSEICFEDFDYEMVQCPNCGSKFDESEIVGDGKCPDCGEYIN